MDLARVLRDLNLTEGSERNNGASACSVNRVLSEIHRRFVAEDSAKRSLLKSAAELLSSGEVCWLFPESSSDLRAAYVELVSSFTEYAALPVCDTDSGTLPSSSYEHIPAKAEAVGAALLALTEQLRGAVRSSDSAVSGSARSLIRTLGPSLCVFSFTHLQDLPWTNEASRKCALELLNSTATATSSGSVLELLCGKDEGDQRGMLGPVLDTLQPELTKENWKRNEAVKHVFSWVLVQVGRPWLADYLEKVFPPSLLISDDYRTENKVLGVHCLHHIVLNVPAADLRQFNRAQVLYHALFNHLYTSEAPLIQVVLPCLIDLMAVLEKPLVHPGLPRKPSRFDDVLRLILTHMEMEHKLVLRRIYTSNLLLFIEKMGIGIARHLKRLERVIVGYLEVSDGPEEKARLIILEVLEKTIQTAWPRMECRMDVLAKSLLRFLVDISSESLAPELRDQLLTRASRCLLLLDHCSHGRLRVLLKEVDKSCVSESVLKCLESLTAPQDM
ncbi:TELO2-interacting protein 2 [Colossoma macropomum]|uniref:TELO2-interacting protein 2 n=1 Tax=Colossoma macropomum TaxID=42526 RepID=UPI001864B760|nr:TELO2-interacting protein 2 [Colossoma macropomum]